MTNEFNKNHIDPNDRALIGLFGAGGFGREVMPIIRELGDSVFRRAYFQNYYYAFVESNPSESKLNGYPLFSEQAFFELKCKERFFNVAIGNSKIREKIVTECLARGAKPLTIKSPSAILYDENVLGDGAILCAHSVITSNARIGKFFHSNIFSYVAHDCVIGDYVTFAPKVCCNGNVRIENHAYIGTGAVIKQGTPSKPVVIGEGAIVGMGAVVTKDVPPFTTVVGNPARPLVRNLEG